jgi:hypothetical protein
MPPVKNWAVAGLTSGGARMLLKVKPLKVFSIATGLLLVVQVAVLVLLIS